MHDLFHILGMCHDSQIHFDLQDLIFLNFPEFQIIRFFLRNKINHIISILFF